MTVRARQQGLALFMALFLITATAGIAAVVVLTTVTQQTGSIRAMDAERAYYAARARLELEIAEILDTDACTPDAAESLLGFTTDFDCTATEVQEGGATYNVFTLVATASRGSQAEGTLVRRTVRSQIASADN